MQLVRLFYRGVNQKKIFYFSRVASSQMGLWVNNFLLIVESRISSILYRFNWISNILFLKQFLSHGNVIVDSSLALNTNFLVKPSTLIQLLPSTSHFIRSDILLKLSNNMIYFNFPRYTFVNYFFMFGVLYRAPYFRDLTFPVLLDIYRLNDLN